MWIRKYMPKTSSEIQGQNTAVAEIKEFIENFRKSKKKAMLVYGPTGCGKTSSIHAIAKESNLEIVELNASDYRKPGEIEEKIGRAINQASLFFSGKIILIDELDGISGTSDRGGLSTISKIIDRSPYPILITANDPYDKKFSSIRKKSEIIHFHALNYLSVFAVLKRICEKENISFDEVSLKSLARMSGGDLRAAINDLQMLSVKKKLTKEELSHLDERNQTEKMHQALLKVFKTTDVNIARSAFNNVSEDIDKIIFWIDENLPNEYQEPADLSLAFERLSRADVFRGRIRRWQHWHFLVYINDLISAGIASSKDERYKGFTQYRPTTRILKLWQGNIKYAKRRSIAQKVATVTHTSEKRATKDVLPFLRLMSKDKNMLKQISKEFDLSKDEISWLKTG